MNIGILGLGSIGAVMAYHWREATLFALPRDQHSPTPVSVKDDSTHWQTALPAWRGEPLDWLVICTKAAATLPALQAWQAFLPQVKHLLLHQNGMGQQQQVADWLNAQNLAVTLWAGMCTEGAYREGEDIIYAGHGKNLIGLWPQGLTAAPSLPATEQHPNITQPILNKLAVNAVINVLSAHLGCRNGELVSIAAYKPQLEALSAELQGLFDALGWQLSKPLVELSIEVAQITAANKSSTLLDVTHNRPTELPYISGFLLEQAQTIGYDLPLSQRLYHELQSRQRS